jgi:hypothetical protein
MERRRRWLFRLAHPQSQWLGLATPPTRVPTFQQRLSRWAYATLLRSTPAAGAAPVPTPARPEARRWPSSRRSAFQATDALQILGRGPVLEGRCLRFRTWRPSRKLVVFNWAVCLFVLRAVPLFAFACSFTSSVALFLAWVLFMPLFNLFPSL